MSNPTVVSYGIGVDSTAMLGAMHQRGERPDLILFADTGAEKPETYAYLEVIQEWLSAVGFPPVVTVRYVPTRAPYSTLEGKCLSNETLPSLAFGKHSCAIVFKHEPMNKFIQTWAPARVAWENGRKVTRCIGYDDGEQDTRRRLKADRAVERRGGDAKYDYRYPLQDWGLDRVECMKMIQHHMQIPLPPKSACWFCPASKKSEIVWLRDTHPVLFHRAVAMERTARNGRHGLDTVKGLGRQFAWSDLAEAVDVVDDAAEALRP